MILHPPFLIGPRLLTALRLGDAALSFESIEYGERDRATFILDFADGTEYRDDRLQSGCGGFQGAVEIFELMLSFMLACGESMRHGGLEGENSGLFPPHVALWIHDNYSHIEEAHMNLFNESGDVINSSLIQD